MNHSTPPHRSVADIASGCSRLGTLGLEQHIRADLLAERASDLAEQLRDPARNSGRAVLGRALRTLVGDITRRLMSDHVSAVPIALAFLVFGIGTLAYSALSTGPGYRLSLLLEGLGFLTLAFAGLRSPLAIRPVPVAAGSIVLATGTALGVVAIPVDSEVLLFVITAKTSLLLATLGFTSLAAGLLTGWDRSPTLPGALLLAAAGLIAFSEIGFAMYIYEESTFQVIAALLTAAGGLLSFRFFGRLRFLPIESQADNRTSPAV